MSPRYQVFISSTFTDLQNERALVQNMLMKLDYIPAGMELFPAIDEEQLAFIKRIIDDSDYYLLIIAGRYGSVGKDGVSYTEKEYDYAISKGMKVIAFIHKNPQSLSLDNSEKDAKARKSLEKFRKKVILGRMVSFWKDASELPGLLAQSLPVTTKAYPAVGWVRADSVPGPEIYKELNDLRKENDILKAELYSQGKFVDTYNIADLEDLISIEMKSNFHSSHPGFKIEVKWGDIFYKIASALMTYIGEQDVRNILSEYFRDKLPKVESPNFFKIEGKSMTAIRIQLRALDLIQLSSGQEDTQGNGIMENILVWSLTSAGERLLVIERASRKAEKD